MSITSVTNSQINGIVESAYKQAFKVDTFTGIDFTKFNGGTTQDIVAERDMFTKALISEIARTYYVDRFKTNVPTSKWYVDSEKYGAIEEWLTVSLPDAKTNSAMASFQNGDTLGTITVALPTITNRVYKDTVSWALPLTITGQQWDTAFKNESSLNAFVMFVYSQFEGNAQMHDYELGLQNRNALIAKKLELTNSTSGIPNGYFNLISGYCKEHWVADGTYNYAGLRNNAYFQRYCLERLGVITNRMTQYNNFYQNTNSAEPYIVPSEDIVTEINEDFYTRITGQIADTYRNNWKDVINLEMISSWQQLDNPFKIKSTTATHDNIVGIIADKYACMHTHVSQRTASKYLELENLTHYEKQYVDRYMYNLDRKLVVLGIADCTVSTVDGQKQFSYTVNGVTITENW